LFFFIKYWLNNKVDQAWKDKFIYKFVSLSGVWGGAVKTLRLMASGDNIDILVVTPIRVRPYQRSATSTTFLMPSDTFWNEDEVLVSRPSRNYTVKDYKDFFNDVGYPVSFSINLVRKVYFIPGEIHPVDFHLVESHPWM
jgi:lysophospholipase-3